MPNSKELFSWEACYRNWLVSYRKTTPVRKKKSNLILLPFVEKFHCRDRVDIGTIRERDLNNRCA